MTEDPKLRSHSLAIGDTLTMVQLKDLKTGKTFAVFNTHLAFGNVDKREFQARFIEKTMASFGEEMPVILTGDMNLFPNRPSLENPPFYDGDYINRIFTKNFLGDAKEVSLLGHLGSMPTFSNLGEDPTPFKGTGTPGVFLDRIYVSKKVEVLVHATESATVEGHYPSDHLPILIDFILEN